MNCLRCSFLVAAVLAGTTWSLADDQLKTERAENASAGTLAPAIGEVDSAAAEARPAEVRRAGQPTPIEPSLERLVELNEPDVSLLAKRPIDPGQSVSTDQPIAADKVEVANDEKPAPEPELYWHDDYAAAVREAQDDRKLLFIYFHDTTQSAARRSFETQTLADPKIKALLAADFVLAKLPVDATIVSGGKKVTLLQHAAFGEMLRRQGVAVIDYAHTKASYFGHVVSTFPFTRGKYYRSEALSIILDLPPGTLTQRTMIYAVRIHPEAPASTKGQFHPVLADEASQQSTYQAAILNQGHHNWDSRFQRINSRLSNGMLAQEVVAESWPNESLVEACVDCVDSWRQSPGHWQAVRSRQPLFGFDIKRGNNGIWYATGIFGRR